MTCILAPTAGLPSSVTTTVFLEPTPLSASASTVETAPSSTTSAVASSPSMQAPTPEISPSSIQESMADSNSAAYTTIQPSQQSSNLQGLSATNTPTQSEDLDPTTSENLSTTFIALMVGTTVGGVSVILIVTVAVVLFTRYIQVKRKHSNSDTRASDDYIQTFPNAAYSTTSTILTDSNMAYRADDYSYPLAVQEEARYIQIIGGGDTGECEYDYCRPT